MSACRGQDLPHRAQVMTIFYNEIPLKMWQVTVFYFRIIQIYKYIYKHTNRIIQTFYAQNYKENGADFYNSVFPGEAKMCLGFMSFRGSPAALKHKN